MNSLFHLSWGWIVLVIFVSGHLTIACVSIFLHRCQTHQALVLSGWVSLPMRLWLWLSTAMVTKEWVACHRKHHSYVDREGDPHSPALLGWLNVLFFGVFYYRKAFKDEKILQEYGYATVEDWLEQKILSPYHILGVFVLLALECLMFGCLKGSIIWVSQMTWVPFWAAGIVNGVGHQFGYRNFNTQDFSRNILPLGIWLSGEELHNNHHQSPGSAKFSVRFFEFDMGWLYIRLFQKMGLAKIS